MRVNRLSFLNLVKLDLATYDLGTDILWLATKPLAFGRSVV